MEVNILYDLYLLLCSLDMKNYVCTMTRMNHTASIISVPALFKKTEDPIQLNICEKIFIILFIIMFSYSVFKVG